MHIIEAPNDYPTKADVFLGGGISNCPDWQSEIIELLADVPGVALNPRRTGEFTEDIADEQITWEYHALRSVHTVFFWFPKETLCPITLLELGVFTQRPNTRLIVGTHPEYARRFDVIKQLELARPEVTVHDSIADLTAEYIKQVTNEVTFEEESPAEWTLLHGDDNLYAHTLKIVEDEAVTLIDNGDVMDLSRAITDNYIGLDEVHVTRAIKELEDKVFSIDPSLRIVQVKK